MGALGMVFCVERDGYGHAESWKRRMFAVYLVESVKNIGTW
jgi:hypothetical protein